MPMRPKLLLFDLDGVLTDYSRELRCRQLAFALDTTEDAIHQALFKRGLEDRCDRGELALADYLDVLRTDYGWNLPEEEFIAARRASTQARPDMLSLCGQLSTQAALGVFSNNGTWLGEHAHFIVPELMPIFRSRFVCSGSVGVCKPEPEAYAACLNRLGFNSFSTLYVDDRDENVEGARAAGLEAIRFETEEALVAVLREYEFDPIDLQSASARTE
jgi:HAD superfamily hydrolase (TIGR01509 family)